MKTMQLFGFLHDDVKIGHNLSQSEEQLWNNLGRFLIGYQEKRKILERLLRGESLFHHLGQLEFLLQEELAEIAKGEHDEHEIIWDLKYLSHDTYLQQIAQLKTQIRDASEKETQLAFLLSELHDVLKAQAQKIHRLKSYGNEAGLQEALINLLTIERGLVEKISDAQSIQHLFNDVYLAEVAEHRLKKSEKRLAKQILEKMGDVIVQKGEVTSVSDHYLSKMTAQILNLLKHEIMEEASCDHISKHPYTDVEYVNSERFENFVRKEMDNDRCMGKLVPSERTIELFIRIFRDIYYREEVSQQ